MANVRWLQKWAPIIHKITPVLADVYSWNPSTTGAPATIIIAQAIKVNSRLIFRHRANKINHSDDKKPVVHESKLEPLAGAYLGIAPTRRPHLRILNRVFLFWWPEHGFFEIGPNCTANQPGGILAPPGLVWGEIEFSIFYLL